MPYIDFPSQRPLTGDFLQKAVGDWSQMLQGLAEVPVYFDLSSPEKLAGLLEDACKALPSAKGAFAGTGLAEGSGPAECRL